MIPPGIEAEAEQLYRLLERDGAGVLQDERGIPRAWVSKMRESMARLAPQFSANRTVREYTESHYLPTATEYQRRMTMAVEPGPTLLPGSAS